MTTNMHTPDNDTIVAELRRGREEYAASLGYDIELIAEDTERRARAVREAMARLAEDPNAIADLLRSKRWNGGRGQLGPAMPMDSASRRFRFNDSGISALRSD